MPVPSVGPRTMKTHAVLDMTVFQVESHMYGHADDEYVFITIGQVSLRVISVHQGARWTELVTSHNQAQLPLTVGEIKTFLRSSVPFDPQKPVVANVDGRLYDLYASEGSIGGETMAFFCSWLRDL